tara:strand:+ start:382 stop:969 length:588 start_codon:yes stop_codon:yes gene_type:complete
MEDVFSLTDIQTYSNKMSLPQSIVEEHFKKLIIEYFEFINRDQKKIVTANSEMYKFTLIRGLETIGHVYKMVLLYTNNVTAAIYHSQRSICLYVEFILQIIENSQTFLKLTTKDAVLYVYRETIFRIRKTENSNPGSKENMDLPENEKYKLREKLNKILYDVVDYIQNKMTGTDVSPSEIYLLMNVQKTVGYITI